MHDKRDCGKWCSLCYANLRGREYHPGHRYASASGGQWRNTMAQFAQRVVPGSEAPLLCDPQLLAGKWMEKCPGIMEYLTLSRWDDGKPRVTSTLLVFIEDGVWKGCLNDRDGARSLWVSGGTLETLVKSLEASISSGTSVWRKSSVKGGPRRG